MPDQTYSNLDGRRANADLPYGVNARISTTQRAFLAKLQEAHGIGLSAAVRVAIDMAEATVEGSGLKVNAILTPITDGPPSEWPEDKGHQTS